jgi:hypothetical protein
VMGRVTKVEMTFFSIEGWELGSPRRVASSSGADSMLQFWLERGGDGTQRCWKMKRRQRARLISMGRKRDTV